MKARRKQNKLPPFFPIYIETFKSPAWLAMSVGARMLHVHLKQRYRRKEQEAVFLSARDAAKELRASKNTITLWYRELRHYGFVVQVQAASFGSGKGKAAHYRLTDEPYLGQPPGMDFTRWAGTPFAARTNGFSSPQVGRRFGFSSQLEGHLRPSRRDENADSAQILRPSRRDISRRRSSHLA